MNNPPKTIEEARAHRFGRYGHRYCENECAFEIQDYAKHQCSRRKGHGINGLYCKQHAKIIEWMVKDEINS